MIILHFDLHPQFKYMNYNKNVKSKIGREFLRLIDNASLLATN